MLLHRLTRELHRHYLAVPRQRISILGHSCSHRATKYDRDRSRGLLFLGVYRMLEVGSA